MSLLDPDQMWAVLNTREGPVLRIENQHQGYADVSSDGDDRLLYDRGDPVPELDLEHGWTGQLHADKDNRTWCKVHLQVGETPTRYERFMYEWYFTRNEQAGERIRVLEIPEPLVPRLPDWHVLGDEIVVLTHFTDTGGYDGSQVIRGGQARPYVAMARLAWQHGTRFGTVWEQNPKWHRNIPQAA